MLKLIDNINIKSFEKKTVYIYIYIIIIFSSSDLKCPRSNVTPIIMHNLEIIFPLILLIPRNQGSLEKWQIPGLGQRRYNYSLRHLVGRKKKGAFQD